MDNYFNVGDYVNVKDDDLQVNRFSRVLSFKRNILKPYQYSLVIGDAIKKDRLVTLIKDVKRIDTKVK